MASKTSTLAVSNPLSGMQGDSTPPTAAAFSPAQSISAYQRRSVLVHQNTPLLIATPPQVTRALAFSHPFLLPLNKLLGLLSWSSDDPWESFLLCASFWALTLFGKDVILWAGPILAVAGLMAGMYARRYSPLSTRAAADKVRGQRPRGSEHMRHQKSLDEIVDTLNTFTARCNIMLNPLLELTDFLSTQQTATSASTRPALTNLFIRLLMTLPLWIALTLPPLNIITARRVVLVVGTIFITWPSRPARISRAILWRNLSVRHIVSLITGLEFASNTKGSSAAHLLSRAGSRQSTATSAKLGKTSYAKNTVRFTFALYENQRRWLGIGWTSSMFAYERAGWTDENLNSSSPKERFHLPTVEGGAKWRWVPGSEWRIETPAAPKDDKTKASNLGWVYTDNNWNDPRRQDSWNRYTRRRKWYRDAELVDHEAETDLGPELPPRTSQKQATDAGLTELPAPTPKEGHSKASSLASNDLHVIPTTPGAVSASGTDAASATTLVNEETRAETASLKSNASSTKRATRRGLLRRRSNSLEMRGDEGSVDRRTRETHESRSVEDGQEWLVGDDVRMGLS